MQTGNNVIYLTQPQIVICMTEGGLEWIGSEEVCASGLSEFEWCWVIFIINWDLTVSIRRACSNEISTPLLGNCDYSFCTILMWARYSTQYELSFFRTIRRHVKPIVRLQRVGLVGHATNGANLILIHVHFNALFMKHIIAWGGK